MVQSQKKDGVIYGFDIQINDVESSNASIDNRRIITWNNKANDNDGISMHWGELELTQWAASNSEIAKFVVQENGYRGWKTTTALNIYFSKDVEDLTADDITLSGLPVTKGGLTKVNNRHYMLEIDGVTQPDRTVPADDPSRYVSVSIDKEGVTTDPASALVFYEMNAPPAGYEYFVSVHDPNFEERMPASFGLNDPFQFFVTTDGQSGGFGEVIPNRVVTEKDWEDRRKEIQALVQYYWYGTTGTFAQGKDIIDIITNVTVSGNNITVTLEDNGISTSITYTVTMPSEESIEAAGYDPNNIPWGIGSNQTDYGIAYVSLPWFGGGNHSDLYPTDYRVTGHDAGSIMQYAWRVGVFPAALEWLEKNDPENATSLNPYGGFVTGVSIGGKQARMAAAMNDRIAVSAASESGAFGINPFRYLQEGRLYNYAGVRQTNHFRYQKTYNSLYYSGEWGWLGLNTARKFSEHNKALIPFDMHLISALMAPTSKNPKRALIEFLNDSQSQGWAAAEPGVMNYLAAKEVFDWLGSKNIAIRVRDGAHALQNRDLPYIIAVMDALFGPEKEYIELRRPFSSTGEQRDDSLASKYYKSISDLSAYAHSCQSA